MNMFEPSTKEGRKKGIQDFELQGALPHSQHRFIRMNRILIRLVSVSFCVLTDDVRGRLSRYPKSFYWILEQYQGQFKRLGFHSEKKYQQLDSRFFISLLSAFFRKVRRFVRYFF
eukprot:TRINITY_DN8907_c0_g1_i6.p5 TRINITY_DN8907_c0_g1~~TRINITY_DN8907_c0_g1_i6.p5  ORF type:complete len:115 (-),score=2.60 TRINITY_DN8907_c0_g1_i6:756-1100(-)